MKFFTVGPTQLHKNFSKHLNIALKKHIPSISHRSEDFKKNYLELIRNIKKLFQAPENYDVVFLGSATEFMERAIQNLSKEKTLHFVSGAFSERCYKFAKNTNREALKIEMENDDSFSLEKIPKNFLPEIIFITHNETSCGHKIPKNFILEIRKNFPNTLLVCDVVSSAPVCDILIEEIDLLFFSVQKAFGLPAGLGVGIISPRLIEKAEKIKETENSKNIFHSFSNMHKNNSEAKTLETPNVLLMFLLNEVVKDFLKKTLKKIKKEQIEKLKILENFFLKHKNFSAIIKNKEWRSETVLVYETKIDSKIIIEKLKKKGIMIATGYGEDKNTRIRIANFPQTNKKDILNLTNNLKKI